jgi:hypothetical protein
MMEWFVRGEWKGLQPQLRGVEFKIPFLFFLVAKEGPTKSMYVFLFSYIETKYYIKEGRCFWE